MERRNKRSALPAFVASRPLPEGVTTADEKWSENFRAFQELSALLNEHFDVGTTLLSASSQPSWRQVVDGGRRIRATRRDQSLGALVNALDLDLDLIVVKVEIHVSAGEVEGVVSRAEELAVDSGWRVDRDQ